MDNKHLHYNVKDLTKVTKIVILTGDPLRAKAITHNELEKPELLSSTRNMYLYYGLYKGVPIMVGASGMGCPSMGIYSYELFKFYDVDVIIRVGTCGGYHLPQKSAENQLQLEDLINVKDCYYDGGYQIGQETATITKNPQVYSADEELFDIINESLSEINQKSVLEEHQIRFFSGRVHCTDIFYRDFNQQINDFYNEKNGCIAVEMETAALFANAKYFGKKAACILTVSDLLSDPENSLSVETRQKSYSSSHLALVVAKKYYEKYYLDKD
jgi:purine-nucleoside phosphorylase